MEPATKKSEPTGLPIKAIPPVGRHVSEPMGASQSASAKALKEKLEEIGQGHLFEQWPDGSSDADKERFFKQVQQLEASYPGGLSAYVSNARKLLADSKAEVNPLEGWQPSIPVGTVLKFGSSEYLHHEALGTRELDGCAFVLVAGGLGERLGFSGIKVALPYQISTDEPYLQLYISSILALQAKAAEATGRSVSLPLAIMVSDDTFAGTDKLLKARNYFGMSPSQVNCWAHCTQVAAVRVDLACRPSPLAPCTSLCIHPLQFQPPPRRKSCLPLCIPFRRVHPFAPLRRIPPPPLYSTALSPSASRSYALCPPPSALRPPNPKPSAPRVRRPSRIPSDPAPPHPGR